MKKRLHAACVTWKPPFTFVFMTFRIASGSISSGPPRPSPWSAALLTRMSSVPASRSMRSMSAATCAASPTSHGCAVTPATPIAASASAPRAVDASDEPHMKTRAPSSANFLTSQSPVLRFPPVTRTTLPLNLFI